MTFSPRTDRGDCAPLADRFPRFSGRTAAGVAIPQWHHRSSASALLQAGDRIAISTGRRDHRYAARACAARPVTQVHSLPAAASGSARGGGARVATACAVSAGKRGIDLPRALQSPAVVRGEKSSWRITTRCAGRRDHVIVFVTDKKTLPGGEIVSRSASTSSEPDAARHGQAVFRSQRAGVLIVVLAVAIFLPLGVSFDVRGCRSTGHYEAVLIAFVSGATLWLLTRSSQAELQTRDGFLLWRWCGPCCPRSPRCPFDPHARLSSPTLLRDGRGLTTTGSTCYRGSTNCAFHKPVALRAAVAGRNGNHRPRGRDPAAARDRRQPDHEDRDPRADEGTKLTPRITETAKGLWLVYALIEARLPFWRSRPVGMAVRRRRPCRSRR